MNAIPVIYSFARSGGTLVNQLLGVHPQCLVLSEVNPAASYKTVAGQAADWLGLAERGEVAELGRMPYAHQIGVLSERAAARGKALVVRDWPTVNFAAGCTPAPVAASGLLEQPLYLVRAGLKERALVVSRRARAMMRSARRHFPGMPGDAELAEAYLRYAQAVAHYPRVHLESLRAEPRACVTRIIDVLGLEAADAGRLLAEFHTFDKCTGNNTLAEPSESSRASTVLPPEGEERAEAEHPALRQADALLGYD